MPPPSSLLGGGDQACAEEQRRWFNDVPPGEYRLEFVAAGLRPATARAAALITQMTLGGAVVPGRQPLVPCRA